MASDAVALGELAFNTLSTRRLSWIYMLRIIVPSALTACARTPLRAGLTQLRHFPFILSDFST